MSTCSELHLSRHLSQTSSDMGMASYDLCSSTLMVRIRRSPKEPHQNARYLHELGLVMVDQSQALPLDSAEKFTL